jgi:hypothetical protein
MKTIWYLMCFLYKVIFVDMKGISFIQNTDYIQVHFGSWMKCRDRIVGSYQMNSQNQTSKERQYNIQKKKTKRQSIVHKAFKQLKTEPHDIHQKLYWLFSKCFIVNA